VKSEFLKWVQYVVYVLLGLLGLYLLYLILTQTLWFLLQMTFYIGLLIAVLWGLYKAGFFERLDNEK